jgi:hypothetical protein
MPIKVSNHLWARYEKTSVKDVIKFREAIKNIVSMLVDRDIPVIERGAKAYVEYNVKGEPVLICIPSIPDDASDKFLMAIRGFIDHEVAHVLFTDGVVGKGYVWNAVEDTFIERKMGEMFKGSKANLLNTQRMSSTRYSLLKKAKRSPTNLAILRACFLSFTLFQCFVRGVASCRFLTIWLTAGNASKSLFLSY